MPSLNSLRTKGGVIVTIVIFVALIAFLIGDFFSAGSNIFNSSKMRVGTVNGHNVGYVEFLNQSDYISGVYKAMWGREALSTQEQEMMYNMTWEQLIMKYSFEPSFDKLGVAVSDEEQIDMIKGVYLSPVITNTFADPYTGVFDKEYLDAFIASARTNDGAYSIWKFLQEQMVENRMMTKYMTLISAGFNSNDLEVAAGVKATNEAIATRVITKPYTSIADSLVTVSESAIKNYYNSHKETFKQGASRDIEYVVFDLVPSEKDYSDAEEVVNAIAAEFAVSDTPMQYAVLNSQTRPDQRYYAADDLNPQIAAIALGSQKGAMYGPVLAGDIYTISRVADIKVTPDSLGAKHILIEKGQTALADSLMREIRRGADFEMLARQFSTDPSARQNGGDLGRFAPEQMVEEFSNAAINARTGDVYSVDSQFGTHIVRLTYKGRPTEKAQIATITYEVDPSEATQQTVYSQAASFLTASNKSSDDFKQNVTNEGLSKRTVRIRNTDRTISGLENPRELIRWAFTEKKGSVSQIMEIDGDYVVAALTDVKEEGYAPVEQAKTDITPILMRQEKAKLLAGQMTGSTIEAVAAAAGEEILDVENIQMSSFYIPEFGVEPKLIGAIASTDAGQLSKPVEGYSGVYMFQVNDIQTTGTATIESEKVKLDTNALTYINERTMQALTEESDVQDMRVKFF